MIDILHGCRLRTLVHTLPRRERSPRAATNISLTPELEKKIAEKLDSGDYVSASDVAREALGRLFADDEPRDVLITKPNAELEQGLAELDRGEWGSGDEARAEMMTRFGPPAR